MRNVGLRLAHMEDFDTEAFELPVTTEDTLPNLTYLLLDHLHFFILGSELYVDGAEWEELAR